MSFFIHKLCNVAVHGSVAALPKLWTPAHCRRETGIIRVMSTRPESFFAGQRPPGLDEYAEVPTYALLTAAQSSDPETVKAFGNVALYVVKLGYPEVLRRPGQALSPAHLQGHDTVWIRREDLPIVKSLTDRLLTDPKLTKDLPLEKRVSAIQRSAMIVVEDLFDEPSEENISRGVKAVSSFVNILVRDPKAYHMLSKLSSHDPYTAKHSIGTAVNAVILGRKLGFSEADLLELGVAGLLHDIGKTKVKREIINKPGPLDEHEWREMQQHSGEGFAIVKDNPTLSERVKRAVAEHHEEGDGSGYPKGLKSDEIHLFARIICISDIFNALTTTRSYSTARSPFDAFQIMRGEKLMKKIDQDLFRAMVLIYGGQVT